MTPRLAARLENVTGVEVLVDLGALASRWPGGAWTLVARSGGPSGPASDLLAARLGPPALRLAVPHGLTTWRGLAEIWRPTLGPIVGCGGGAALDAAKLIATFTAHGRASRGAAPPGAPRPRLICVPTTAGSGAELTQTASLWDGGRKQALDDRGLRPDMAVYGLTSQIPPPVEVATAAYWDAISHALESLWSAAADSRSSELALFALGALCAGPRPVTAARREAGAATAGAAITITRTGLAHALSYRLTEQRGCPHGLAAGLWSVALADQLLWDCPLLEASIRRALGRADASVAQRLRDLWFASGAQAHIGRFVRPGDLATAIAGPLSPERARLSRRAPSAEMLERACSAAGGLI